MRKESKEVIFDSSAASLIFETQYLRLRTSLPDNPNLYGFGEDTDPFRLNTTGMSILIFGLTISALFDFPVHFQEQNVLEQLEHSELG